MEPLLRGYELLLNFELFIEKELQQNDIYSSIFCGAIAGIYSEAGDLRFLLSFLPQMSQVYVRRL